jgi:pilus assembly protein Flp/PilA
MAAPNPGKICVGSFRAALPAASGEGREVTRMRKYFRFIKRREEGQAMVEYALILALVSVVSVLALTAIGTNVNAIFGAVRDALASVPIP